MHTWQDKQKQQVIKTEELEEEDKSWIVPDYFFGQTTNL